MKYVNKRMVLVLNKMVVKMTGGSNLSGDNIRDGQSLGFIERIFDNNVFGTEIFPTIYHQAAAYMFYIVKNHIFHDGNKRTGLVCAVTFLEWNRIAIAPFDEDSVFDFVISIADGDNEPDTVIPKIADWFKNMSLS